MKELTIQHIPGSDNEAARVRVNYRRDPNAQPQEREAEFRFSVEPNDRGDIQWYLEEFLHYPWGEFLTRAERVKELMIRLGQDLFEAVFDDRETAALYAHIADDLGNTRIVIHAADPVGISLPWELIRDPVKAEFGDLARLAHSFVRSQPNLIFDTPTPSDREAFNILLVICRPGGPDGDIPFQSLARPLVELFREHKERIHLDVLRPPTFEQLSRVLSDKPDFYHALHFDGHGAFPQGCGTASEQGLLLFEGEDDKPRREITGEELGGLIAGKRVPIVLLDACQSGMTRPESLYLSVGNQILKAGAGGVVAMTYSVYVQTAVRFMARLYQGLANGEQLARAVSNGREELRSHPQRVSPIGDIELKDWMVPVLFEAAPIQVLEPRDELRLDTSVLEDRQVRAGAEIDCPDAPAYGFVGRDNVTLELERSFQTETTVLMQGMAGVGKTEMAMGFARWLAETGGLDGPIFFFKFENYLPLAQVCDRVGQLFNVDIKRQMGTEWHLLDAVQRRGLALDILKQVPCLMIWDNFEPVHGFPEGTESAWTPEEQEELRKFLRDLSNGRTKVLITSRRDEGWLGNIYRRVELSGLKLIEAQDLALRVLRRAGLNVEQIRSLDDYNDLLQYLRGNPLAIQVIIPELKRTSAEDLLNKLRTGEATFTRDDPWQGRERSLTASLTYRLDALDETLRRRLGILALFQGLVDADLLAYMCSKVEGAPDLLQGLGKDDWIRLLDSAAEVGLLRQIGKGLYTVHPALPWFFHDLLEQAFPGQDEWFERAYAKAYSQYGAYLHQMFDRSAESAMSLLAAEEDNLTHALGFARKRERWNDMHGILYGMMRLLTMQGRWVEWERLITNMEQDVTDPDGNTVQGGEGLFRALLGHRSRAVQYRRDFVGAEAILLRLKDHYEGAGDDRNVATALHQLGRIAEERREFAEAERWYRQSLGIEERIGNEHGQAATLHQLGIIAEERRDFDGAEGWYRQSLAIKERIGNEHGQAITLHQLGRIAQERRDFAEAERWYRQSLAIEERIGNEHGQAISLHQLGRIAEERRDFAEAEQWYRQSLAIKERIGNEHGQAGTLHQLGRIAEEQDDITRAISLYEQAEAIYVRLNDPHNLGIVRSSLDRVRGK